MDLAAAHQPFRLGERARPGHFSMQFAPHPTFARNRSPPRSDLTHMYDQHAQRLQRLALEALGNLRSWLWEQHGALLPDDVAAISRDEAQRYAACLQWYSAIEDVLRTLQSAGPVPGAALLASEPSARGRAASRDEPAPTLRVPPVERPSARSGLWHRTIALEAPGCSRVERTRSGSWS
jgi:hypothetical protein